MKEKWISFIIGILVGVVLCTWYYYLLWHQWGSNWNHRRWNGNFSRYRDWTGSGSSATLSGSTQRQNLENNQ